MPTDISHEREHFRTESRSRDGSIAERPSRSVIGALHSLGLFGERRYDDGRRSDLVDVDTKADGQSRGDREVEGGFDWNVGSQVRPARHERLQRSRRIVGMGLLPRRARDEGFPH
jgi:hypothetical protein